MINSNYLHSETTQIINQAFYKVYNTLGIGFLEKVYENALFIELKKVGLQCAQQQLVKVYYEGEQIGYYYADIIVENKIIIELKAAETLCEAHEAQLVNYLRASEIEVGVLLNFGKKPQHKRKVLTAEYKNHKKT